VDADTLTDLLTFVADLGLDEIDSLNLDNAQNVADASTTVVRYFDDSGEHRISIYALGLDSGADARSAIVESMIDRLTEATDRNDAEPYVAERLAVFAPAADGLDTQQTTSGGPWPFEFTPSDQSSDVAGFGCLTVEGDEADATIDLLEGADAMTTWELDGASYRVIARPLLPHQDGC
jgi:hypothetical protein